jgi:hypothetical protein
MRDLEYETAYFIDMAFGFQDLDYGYDMLREVLEVFTNIKALYLSSHSNLCISQLIYTSLVYISTMR